MPAAGVPGATLVQLDPTGQSSSQQPVGHRTRRDSQSSTKGKKEKKKNRDRTKKEGRRYPIEQNHTHELVIDSPLYGARMAFRMRLEDLLERNFEGPDLLLDEYTKKIVDASEDTNPEQMSAAVR